MTALRLLLAFGAPLLPGLALMALADRGNRLTWLQRLVLGYFPGAGLLMSLLFVMGLAGISLTLAGTCAALALITGLAAAAAWRLRPGTPTERAPAAPWQPLDKALLALFLVVGGWQTATCPS